jgi:EAL domain-containing protein (putative c-di-GMP-specific phosphodiesterase class I)
MMNDVDASLDTMLGLKALGVSLAVDDFGTGWSSLGYLKTFPVSALKVDQSFVAGLDSDHHDHSIVEATLRLGEALGLNIIAEGVETLAQADRLQEMGCLRAQGYLFGVPRSLDDTEAWLRSAAKFGANASLSGGPGGA